MDNRAKILITNKIKETPSIILKVMENEYRVIYMKDKRNIRSIGVHPIWRVQAHKGWKKLDRETRRFTFNTILNELKQRKENQ